MFDKDQVDYFKAKLCLSHPPSYQFSCHDRHAQYALEHVKVILEIKPRSFEIRSQQ